MNELLESDHMATFEVLHLLSSASRYYWKWIWNLSPLSLEMVGGCDGCNNGNWICLIYTVCLLSC